MLSRTPRCLNTHATRWRRSFTGCRSHAAGVIFVVAARGAEQGGPTCCIPALSRRQIVPARAARLPGFIMDWPEGFLASLPQGRDAWVADLDAPRLPASRH